MAADSGNDVITSAGQRPEMEMEKMSRRDHVSGVWRWRLSRGRHLSVSLLLILVTPVTSQSLALVGKYVNKQLILYKNLG